LERQISAFAAARLTLLVNGEFVLYAFDLEFADEWPSGWRGEKRDLLGGELIIVLHSLA